MDAKAGPLGYVVGKDREILCITHSRYHGHFVQDAEIGRKYIPNKRLLVKTIYATYEEAYDVSNKTKHTYLTNRFLERYGIHYLFWDYYKANHLMMRKLSKLLHRRIEDDEGEADDFAVMAMLHLKRAITSEWYIHT